MKKLIYILLFTSIFLSCESDEEITYTTPDYISGKWFLKEIGSVNSNNLLVFQPYINDAGCENDNLLLDPSNSFTETNFTATTSGCTNISLNGTYNLNIGARTLTLNYGENQIEQFIVSQLFFEEMLLVAPNDIGVLTYYRYTRNETELQ